MAAETVAEPVTNKFLTTQRKPLEEQVPNCLMRWFLRWVFERYGFACRSHVCNNENGQHGNGITVTCPQCSAAVVTLCDGKCYASIEYRGVFDEEADARWLASCRGGAYKEIPYNAGLGEETVKYGKMDVPLSEASRFYRSGVRLPFVAIPREQLDRLERQVRSTDALVDEYRKSA